MTIYKPNKYRIKDDRICKWIYDCLIQDELYPIESTSSCEGRRNAISRLFTQMSQDEKEKEQIFNDLIALANDNLINARYFEWLKVTDERLCYWVWCYMNNNKNYQLNFERITSIINPTNSTERVQAIISFIDNWDVALLSKQGLLNEIKTEWYKVYSSLITYKWLDKNDEEGCKIVWEYMLEKKVNFYFIKPINAHELYGAIIATMDEWFDHPAEKELFIIKLTKSVSRKRFLAKNIKRKYQNIFMGIKEKEKLDQIAALKGKKINEMLELLINNEYKKIKDEKGLSEV